MVISAENTDRKWWGRRDVNVSTSGPSLSMPPHSQWFHPHKTILETFLSFFLRFFIPLYKMLPCPTIVNDKTDPKELEPLKNFRQMSYSFYEMALNDMRQKYQWEGMPCLNIIPRKGNILIDWGIVSDYSLLLQQNQEVLLEEQPNMVPVYVHGPSRLINTTKQSNSDDLPLQSSCLSTLLNLEGYPLVPIILWFHGGGMVAGSAKDNRALAYVRDILHAQRKTRNQQQMTSDDILLITADYSLAPERPFPSGIIDCLSVVEHLIDFFPSHPIHIAGESAGANLTAVVALECARRYPGRISSAFINQPMFNPTADTMSYHANSNSSFLNGDWMRWCWRAYLSLDIDTSTTRISSVDVSSHINAVSQSKWATSSDNWQRLFAPYTELPTNDALEQSFWIIIASKADPLFDEGRKLAGELLEIVGNEVRDEKKIVTYIETNGDHVTGLLFDKEKYSEIIEAVRQHLFGN